MHMRSHRAIILALGVFLLLLGLLACTAVARPTPLPTPDLQATVTAAVAEELARRPTPTAIVLENVIIKQVVVTATPPLTPRPTPTPVLSQIPFDELKGMAALISYDDLFRNNERHVRKLVYYQARLIQILDAGKDSYQLRADVTRGDYSWKDTVFLHYSGGRPLEDDIIEFVGKVNGLIKYKSIFGQEITIPEIAVIQSRLVAKASEPAPTPTPAISPTPIPTPAPGYGRSNPADIGTVLFVKVERLGQMFEVRLTLLDEIRGQEAWMQILAARRFYDPPEPGREYVLAKVRFEYLKGPTPDTQYRVSPYEFTAVSSGGRDYSSYLPASAEPELRAELYPGGSHEGWALMQVAQDDKTPLITFGREYQGRGGVWWKLYK